jgi:hypothetical protein
MTERPSTDLKTAPYWAHEAKAILRAELERRGVTYAKLARLMRASHFHETERSLANKISRGSFSFVFFLQVMRVLGVTSISVAPTEKVESLLYSGQPTSKEGNRPIPEKASRPRN